MMWTSKPAQCLLVWRCAGLANQHKAATIFHQDVAGFDHSVCGDDKIRLDEDGTSSWSFNGQVHPRYFGEMVVNPSVSLLDLFVEAIPLCLVPESPLALAIIYPDAGCDVDSAGITRG